MKTLRWTLCATCGVMLMGAADRLPPPARVSAARAALAAPSGVIPAFSLFGWVSPPVDRSTPERIAELAGCGLNTAMPAWADSGEVADNRARMDAAATVGVRCLTFDRRLRNVIFGVAGGEAPLDTIVPDYQTQPGFLGWYFTDEPQPDEFALLAEYHRALRERDPGHFAFNNLLGRGVFATRALWEAYIRDYVETVHPAVLSADYYDLFAAGDGGLYVEHVATLQALAREYGLPFWNIVQLTPHGPYRVLQAGELRWQVSVMLAFGARGVGYFTYWTPPPDPQWNWQPGVIDWDGTRTPWYDVLTAFNPHVRAAGEALASLTWLATSFAGGVPAGGTAFVPDGALRAVEGRAAIGSFADSTGQRHLLIVNRDSLATRDITLKLHGVTLVEQQNASGEWMALPMPLMLLPPGGDLPITLTLEAGDFTLLRITETDDGTIVAGNGPSMTALPTPARDVVRFALDHVADQARLEILDAGGRRVWSATPARGASSIEWRGETDRGGRAEAGLYFARLEDARGVVARRVVWLGAN